MSGRVVPPQWATVKSTVPLEVLVDGAVDQGPATAPPGASFANEQRVLTWLVGRTLLVINAYVASAAPVGQDLYLKSPNGTVFKLSVSDAGSLKADPT